MAVYAEDIRAGTEYALGSYTLSEADIIRFASEWDLQGFHTDPAVGRRSPFGGVIASGIHTVAICNRLSVEATFSAWAVIAGRRLVDVEFHRPVRACSLTGTLRVLDVRLFPERRRGLVTTQAELFEHNSAELLFAMTVQTYVHTRSPGHSPK
ncbi:MaoC/PaaZ C-terminal domain-containing protein [Mycolicibacterium thermoresistibile]